MDVWNSGPSDAHAIAQQIAILDFACPAQKDLSAAKSAQVNALRVGNAKHWTHPVPIVHWSACLSISIFVARATPNKIVSTPTVMVGNFVLCMGHGVNFAEAHVKTTRNALKTINAPSSKPFLA